MTWIEAIILGIIQGLSEFLPVSSSGHLEIGSVLLGIKTSNNLLFAVVLHAATALSTIVVFRKDIADILVDLLKFKWNESYDFAAKILLSMIPVGVIGVLFEDEVEQLFTGNMILVGLMLIVTALLLLLSSIVKENIKEITYSKALIIGIMQAVAIIPGISRSGSTITIALMLGVDRTKAARFSFLMVLIPILGASFLKMMDYFDSKTVSEQLPPLILASGFIAAFISGYLACKWMITLVKKGRLIYFAFYCLLVGSIAIVTSMIL